MSTTPGGLPYPESTGPSNQGANDIKALALALDNRGGALLTQYGAWQTVTSDANGRFYVDFPVPFARLPVMCLAITAEGGPFNIYSAAAPTTTRAQFRLYYLPTNVWAGVSNVTYSWLAVGPAT